MALLIKGDTNTQIDRKLVVSPAIVKSHVSNMVSKLVILNRTEAVALAAQHLIIAAIT